LFVAFCSRNLRFFVSLSLEDARALAALCDHLFAHRVLDVHRWLEALDLDTCHIDSPFRCLDIESCFELRIDDATIGESIIETHRTEHTTEIGLCEIEHGETDIIDLVSSLYWVFDTVVYDTVDIDIDIICSDDLLLGHVNNLFANIDPDKTLKSWYNKVHSWMRETTKASQCLDHTDISLFYDLDKHRNDDNEYSYQSKEKWHMKSLEK
jgi:hypothetical protein